MKLVLGTANANHAMLLIDGDDTRTVTITDASATAVAVRLARAFNRDKHFEALIAALTPFRSSEMGNLLVCMIDVRESGGEKAQQELSRMIKLIDVILDAAEQADGTNE